MQYFRQSFAAKRDEAARKALADSRQCQPYDRKPSPQIYARQLQEPFAVDTPEGVMQGEPGDWFVIGTRGEQYIIKNMLFQELYKARPTLDCMPEMDGGK